MFHPWAIHQQKFSTPPFVILFLCCAPIYFLRGTSSYVYIYIYIYIYLWWHLWFYSIVEGLCTASRRNKERVGWGVICCATTKNILRIYIVFSLRPPPTNENAPLLPLCCPIFQLCHSISLIEARSLPFDEPTFASPLSRTRPNR